MTGLPQGVTLERSTVPGYAPDLDCATEYARRTAERAR